MTTYLQSVTVEAINDYAFTITCCFLNETDLKMCKVVLVSDHPSTENVTEIFTFASINTWDQCFHRQLNLVLAPSSCYHRVYGFDVEVNITLTNGDIAMKGNLRSASSKCLVESRYQ